MEKIENNVKQIISEQIGVNFEKINGDMIILKKLGLDSVDLIELIMSLEEHFSIKIEDEQIEKMKTLSDITNYIKKIKKKII